MLSLDAWICYCWFWGMVLQYHNTQLWKARLKLSWWQSPLRFISGTNNLSSWMRAHVFWAPFMFPKRQMYSCYTNDVAQVRGRIYSRLEAWNFQDCPTKFSTIKPLKLSLTPSIASSKPAWAKNKRKDLLILIISIPTCVCSQQEVSNPASLTPQLFNGGLDHSCLMGWLVKYHVSYSPGKPSLQFISSQHLPLNTV